MKVLLLAVVAMSSVLSTQAINSVSLELQGGNCSDQLTLICRHSERDSSPLWIHNGTTVESGQVLGTAFPGAVYNVLTRTEHTTTITGVDTVRALDGYIIQCVYSALGNITKSNAVKYSFIPPDFQPKLKRTNGVQSFSERFCSLNYELEDYTEGIAKYSRCADQFSVNFTVAPNAKMNSISTDAVAQCNITILERCKVYDIFARFYRRDQVLDTVYDVDSVMTTPGAFDVSNVTFVSSTVIHITIEEISPDCVSFPTLWYNITIRRGDGASKQMKQMEANNFSPLNNSMVTITVIFDIPLPQGMFDVEVLKVNAVPVKRLAGKDTPVYTDEFQYWNSSSKATVFNPHLPPPTMAGTTVPPNDADLAVMADVAVVAGVSAAVLVVCVVVCCVVLCVCMICCRKRKSTQGYYTIGKPPGTARLNSYEAVRHVVVLSTGEEEHVGAEVGTSNIQEAFSVREMVSSDELQGVTDLVQEDDEVLPSDFLDQSAEIPLEDWLEEEKGQSASALQRDDLKQFHNADNACVDGDRVYTFEESAAVYKIDDDQSFNEPLSEEEQGMSDIVIMVVGRTEKVVVGERRSNPTLEEDTLSVSSSTSLQDPRDVIAEMSVKSVVVNQVHSSDRKDELAVQDGGKASVPSNPPPESDDNAPAATKEEAVEFHEDSSEAGTDSLPQLSVAVAELKRDTLCELPHGKAQVDNDKECASTITKPSGNVRVGLQPSHYADIDFSKKGPIPAPRNEMYNVVYAEIKK